MDKTLQYKKQLGEADLKKKKKRSMKSETQISQVK